MVLKHRSLGISSLPQKNLSFCSFIFELSDGGAILFWKKYSFRLTLSLAVTKVNWNNSFTADQLMENSKYALVQNHRNLENFIAFKEKFDILRFNVFSFSNWVMERNLVLEKKNFFQLALSFSKDQPEVEKKN